MPRSRRRQVALLGLLTTAALIAAATPARATFPFPPPAPDADPYDYTQFHIENGACTPLAPGELVPPGSDLPAGFDCRNEWELTDYAAQPGDPDYDPAVATNPQELFGVKGAGTNRAWEVTTGRPDTVIAVLDSGIRWSEDTPDLVNKFWLNAGELPTPGGDAKGAPLRTNDVNDDGIFNVADYAGDDRVADFPDDANDYVDPADLIRTFSDGVDDDSNGYPDDISGWDFYEGDNDAGDDTSFGHGTGESRDSAAEIELTVTECPNCMLLELRVGDSFVADINSWAEATVYAVDNGASVVQEALGTVDHTRFAQAAADYAYRNGVLIVASEADESAGHHNWPAALNHTMVVNSVTQYDDGLGAQSPKSYLSFNGCTNFGGYTWMSVPSASCSSEATGESAGMAGLLYSAARTAVELGVIQPGPSGRPLSAEEAKQLFRVTADDIDFSTPAPPFPANNFATSLIFASQKYVTTAGWDQISGWGRVNAAELVRAVASGAIPPEADITSPRWWAPLGTEGTVEVRGRVAAPRAGSYTFQVLVAPGVQPPRFPDADQWVEVASGAGRRPRSGVLATLDLAAVRAAIDAAPPVYTPEDDPTSRDMPEQDAFRVRVVVSDDRADTADAIEQRPYFSTADADLVDGFPMNVQAQLSSPAFDDLDGDGDDELVVADSNGFVHAYQADGSELGGWPVRTPVLGLPSTGNNAYTTGEIGRRVSGSVLVGAPVVADLDDDGRPEVAVTDVEGHLSVWNNRGRPLPGFPVRGNPAYSEEPGCQTAVGPACDDFSAADVRSPISTVDRGLSASPSAGDLDPSFPGRELVVGANDGHVYAWHADGTPVPGWPVLLRDPTKVVAVDPVTHQVTYAEDSGMRRGNKIITTPTLADLDGDGVVEVISNVNEEYAETPNWSGVDPAFGLIAAVQEPGNTRVYALHHDGTEHPATAASSASPHPDDQAYVDGWPVPIGLALLEILPNVGEGSNGAPVAGDVDGDGTPEIGTSAVGGPAYLLRADGSSYYGVGEDGAYQVMATSGADYGSDAADAPSFAFLGGGVFGRLGGVGAALAYATPAGGLLRLVDVALNEQQLGPEDHLGAWDAASGSYLPGFPAQMNDMQFFNTAAVADVDGDGAAELLHSSAMYDARAYGLGGSVPPGWHKFTGGWSTSTPAVGDLDGDGRLEVALGTREGNLFVWRTTGSACQPAEWPKYQHDLANTGTYGTDADRPGSVGSLLASRDAGGALQVSWTAPGDDGPCGTASTYEVRVDGVVASVGSLVPGPAGAAQELVVPGGGRSVSVWAVDEAGNRGPAVTVAGG